jgi:hypothetical protein
MEKGYRHSERGEGNGFLWYRQAEWYTEKGTARKGTDRQN